VSKRVAVLDHGMGNLRSVSKALEAAGATVDVTGDAKRVLSCDALCVPGQGIFGRCMTELSEKGLADLVREWISNGRPYLGICLGMQVLFDSSEEKGPINGLGILGGRAIRLPSSVRVPHIGWNNVRPASDGTDGYFYFDHSYAVRPTDDDIVRGWCEHGNRFAAVVRSGSVLAVQFHPEKSGTSGIDFLKGWVS
jgi:imidazole glycerol-phosphate synthase subunit HisH